MKRNKFKQTEIGEIPEDWEFTTAKYYCYRVTDGTHNSPKKKEYGKYLITSRHLKNNCLDFNNAYFISEKDFNEINKRSKVDQFDILFSMIGTIGELYLEKSQKVNYAIKNVGLFKFKGDELKARWFYYFVKSPLGKQYIETRRAGSTQQYLALHALRNFPLVYPKSKDEMYVIIKILSDLDAKIELNNQMNKTLEEIGQAIFKHWFIDFEFPNEEGKPYKSSGGEMVYNKELGKEIPKGWKVKRLIGIFNFERGTEPGAKEYKENFQKGYVCFIRVGDLSSGRTKVYVNKKLVNNKLCKPKDILLSLDASVGIVKIGYSGAFSSGIRKISSKKTQIPKSYIYWLMKSKYIQKIIKMYAKGTTILHAGESLKHMIVAFPDTKTLNKFSDICEPLFNLLIKKILENQNLSMMRDSLLPKLMTGKIRVPLEVKK